MPERGVWHSFVTRYIFGDQTHGSIHVWIDGNPILAIDPMPLGAWSEPEGPYNKFGVYCADGANMPAIFAINYANMAVGFDDMSALIQNPAPVPEWTWGA
jgi:hypothetical protein